MDNNGAEQVVDIRFIHCEDNQHVLMRSRTEKSKEGACSSETWRQARSISGIASEI